MNKCPYFPFYTQDFIVGIMFLTNEEVGIYIKLLCIQHQHGGLISKEEFNRQTLGHDHLRSKFIETEDGFYNYRLMQEMNKYSTKSSNLSSNAKKRWDMQLHSKSNAIIMPTEDEDENEIENEYTIFEKNVLNEWNILCNEYPILNKIIKISGSRRKHLKQRFAEKTFIITDIVKALKEQPKIINGLRYKEGGEWRVSFDWLIANDNNYIKVLERRYKGDDANAMPSFIRTK